MKVWILALMATSSFVLCDSLSAYWAKGNRTWPIVVVILLSPAGYLFFAYLNKYQKLGVAGMIVNLGIAIGSVVVGFLVFKERLTPREMIGAVIGIIAIYVIASGGDE